MPRVALTGQIMLGIVKVVNFAHGACFMMGAFISYLPLSNLGIGYWGAIFTASQRNSAACDDIHSDGTGPEADSPDPQPVQYG